MAAGNWMPELVEMAGGMNVFEIFHPDLQRFGHEGTGWIRWKSLQSFQQNRYS
jgi:hypothetical protein